MRKLIATALTAALITSFGTMKAAAQNINVQVSKTYNSKDFTPVSNALLPYDHSVEAVNNNIVISLHQKMVSQFGYTANINRARYSILLNKRDADLKLVKENNLESGEPVYGPIPSQIVNANGKVFLIYTKPTGDNSKNSESSYQMFTAEVNPETLELSIAKELFPLEKLDIGFGGFETYATNSRFVIKPSPDNNKWLVFVNSGMNNLIHMAVLDKYFNPIWSRNEKIEDGKFVVANDVCINNDGNVFLIFKKYLKGDDTNNQLAAYSSSQKKEYNISSSTTWLNNGALTPSKYNNDVFASISTGTKSPYVSSIVISKISGSDFKLSPYKTIAFDEDLVKKFDDAGMGSTKAKTFGVMDLKLQGFEMEDSSLALVGQAHEESYGARNMWIIKNGSYLVIRFKNNNPIISTIPRNTSFDKSAINYYTPYVYKNKLLLFYNDMPENFEITDWKKIKSNNIYSKFILAMASIDESGTIERKIIMDDRKNNSLSISSGLNQVSPNKLRTKSYELTGFGNLAKEYKIVTLTIN